MERKQQQQQQQPVNKSHNLQSDWRHLEGLYIFFSMEKFM